MRVVSLVPSLTEAVAHLGAADDLVGVTRYCEVGASPAALRVGGTKNPDLAAIRTLAPDLVLANTEENRAPDLDALRDAGLRVLETFPRTVADVGPMLTELARSLERPGAADGTIAELERAVEESARGRPRTPVAVCVLVWRRPWMGVGPDTFVDDLLRTCGLANVLAGAEDRYPELDPALHLGPQAVLLPSEPYAFSEDDLPAVRDLLGDVPARFVDGQLLTWHGPRTATAVRVLTDLAAELSADA